MYRPILLLLMLPVVAWGQPSTPTQVEKSFAARRQQAQGSILKNYPVRHIGPTVQGGRIVDIEVNEGDPSEYYVGLASGGIFKTQNNGITFVPVFDHQDALGIGDFALSQKNTSVLYVGTGEKHSSRSSYAGSGMYKSTDAGRTWQALGLVGTQHISRVLIHPNDDNTVWVAALGALYSHHADRGVYKTTDGGKTWTQKLFINDSTGISDLVLHPQNPNVLWAAAWERTRKAWNFKGNGPGSAIYKSEDGGETWTKTVDGFPQGKFVGRIGLDVSASQPHVVFAVVDNQQEIKTEKKEAGSDKLKPVDFREMTAEAFLNLDDKRLEDFLREYRFPAKNKAATVKAAIRSGRYSPAALFAYVGTDANADLFNIKIKGLEVYRSDDGGNKWKRTHEEDIEGVYFSYGYYFGEMRVSPASAEDVYVYGVPILHSGDGGKTWREIDSVGTMHSDHHALWINPRDARHMRMGNDGGLYESYDKGETWRHINNLAVGQFYTVNVDMETPYQVYGGLQDNGVLRGSSRSVINQGKHWEMLFGGDGMYVAPDPRNSKLVYTGFQFGNYFRLELDKQKTTRITPVHEIGEPPLRWNWRTPLILSKHNPDIVYIAAQRLYRSVNRGENWEAISGDLTRNAQQGNVPFSTVTSVSESPLKFGLLYAGTDDGHLWVTRNGGGTWEPIHQGLPAGRWVSSVFASAHEEGTVLVSLNGYREDEFKTYLFMSTDYGKTWRSVSGNLPESVANVIIQDPVVPDLLYCGLDNGTYVSWNRGRAWQLLSPMLNVASYDMLVHPRDQELVVATHGRSVMVADVKPFQQLKDPGRAIMVFAPESIRYSDRWGQKLYAWSAVNEPAIKVLYYVGQPVPSVSVEITDEKGTRLRTLTIPGAVGFQSWTWDLSVQEPAPSKKGGKATPPPGSRYATKGQYTITMRAGSETSKTVVEIK